jgi:hypothetical protein
MIRNSSRDMRSQTRAVAATTHREIKLHAYVKSLHFLSLYQFNLKDVLLHQLTRPP